MASWLAMRPGAGDADFPDRARLDLRPAHLSLRPSLHEVERVQRGLRLRGLEEVGEGLLLGAVAVLDRPLGATGDQVERAVRSRGRAVNDVFHLRARLAHDFGDVGEIGVLARRRLLGQRNRLVDQPFRRHDAVDQADLVGLARVEHLVLAQRVVDDQLHRGVRADELRRQLGRAPGRDEPEQHLRRGDVAHVVGRDAVVAMKR